MRKRGQSPCRCSGAGTHLVSDLVDMEDLKWALWFNFFFSLSTLIQYG